MSHHDKHEEPREKGGPGEKPGESDPGDAAEPERPQTLQEKEGRAAHQQDDPPKAEGNRDEAEEA